jgi:hypothetical protein
MRLNMDMSFGTLYRAVHCDCRLLVGKPEGRSLETPKRRWVDNIKMDLGEIDCGLDWSVSR